MDQVFETFSFSNAISQANIFWSLTLVFVTSLLGSLHCATMCGGLSMSAASSRSSIFNYHFGRLIGYTLIGGMVGLMGQKLFSFLAQYNVYFVVILLFMFIGLFYFLIMNLNVQKKILKILNRLRIKKISNTKYGFVLGVATPLIPCGWLYAFILIAFSSGQVLNAVFLLFVFWLGTVPILFIFQLGLYKYLPKIKWIPKSLLILFLVGFSFYNLTQHFQHAAHSHSNPKMQENTSGHHHEH